MFKPVPSNVEFPALERDVLQFWHDREIFRRSVDERPEAQRFVFYEGPPTANGSPGIHHVLARVFKDLIPRYWTMKGYCVDRKGGWDTHGLPVELEVERELGISSKAQIEAYGIAEFNRRCRESVFRYVQDWETMTDRIGFWIDMESPYVTYENSYIESGWWILKQLWDRDLIFQDYKVTPHCPRCGTSLSSHELALGYRDDTEDPSVYVKFKLNPLPTGHELGELPVETSFLVWTTTPWTLPGNVALAINPDASYALVENRAAEGEEPQYIILAAHLVEQALRGETKVLKVCLGSHLLGLTYEPLYSFLPLDKPAHRVVGGDFVSLEDGTGIVHMAPAFGEIDLQVGRSENLPVLITVDQRGNIIDVPAPFSGMFVKDADPLISRDLAERGRMYRAERIKHTYPFCWRCETPLLYYAKTSWYIRTTAVKERLITANEEINWYPEHIKQGRFGDWLKNNVDWAISRERYWGTPLPFWRCDSCQEWAAVGSVAELGEKVGDPARVKDLDLHRPYVDDVTWACACGGTFRRTPEVMDCWFDSGAMPVAQWHYPFANQDTFNEQFPADYICEAIDQTRGWFYSLHALSVLLFGQPCYRNVICLGHILDSKGEKMSKSRGNVVEPMSVLDKHGADAVRWYLYTASAPGNPRRFSSDLVGEVVRKFLLTLWNTYSFFVIYANIDGFDPSTTPAPAERSELDRWILSELHDLVREVRADLDNYDPTGAGRAIQAFVTDLSNWYVRRSRRRFWKSESDTDKWAAYHTLYECLATVAHLLAPFTPFVAEELYQNLVRGVRPDAPESVHLARFPEPDLARIDDPLMRATASVQRVVSLGRAARSKASLKVRQPLGEVVVKLRSAEERTLIERFSEQILDELNVKTLRFAEDEGELVSYVIKPNLPVVGPKYGKEVGRLTAALRNGDASAIATAVRTNSPVNVDSFVLEPSEVLVEVTGREGYAAAAEAGYVVALSTAVSPELAREGLVREVVHRLQGLRKDANFDIADSIQTYLVASGELREALTTFADYLKQETLSTDLRWEQPPADIFQASLKIDGQEFLAGVRRAN